jgi:D-sedoheptulose 7-phosphate isomerase
MQYPEQYRTELLNALKSIDLTAIDKIVEIFREARAHGRCIFVCGGGSNAVAASRLLCDMVRSSNVNRTKKFRIFALSDEPGPASVSQDDLLNEQALVDELRNVASTGDVVVGINTSGNSRSVLRAFQYAKQIGCRTICIAGKGGGKLAALSDTAVLVPASQPANVEDTHMIVCRMIGHYFVNFDQE